MKPTQTKTGVAVEILKILNTDPKQSPEMLDHNLPYSRGSIKAALHYLSSLGHVSTVARGFYVITELGECVLRHLSSPSSGGTE